MTRYKLTLWIYFLKFILKLAVSFRNVIDLLTVDRKSIHLIIKLELIYHLKLLIFEMYQTIKWRIWSPNDIIDTQNMICINNSTNLDWLSVKNLRLVPYIAFHLFENTTHIQPQIIVILYVALLLCYTMLRWNLSVCVTLCKFCVTVIAIQYEVWRLILMIKWSFFDALTKNTMLCKKYITKMIFSVKFIVYCRTTI